MIETRSFRVLAVVTLVMTFTATVGQTSSAEIEGLRKEAEQGDAEAQTNLGDAYYFGEGVAKDWREAVLWYRKAAEQGHTSAQFYLGNAYYNGEGITQDQREAVRWFQKAAEQGLASAQYNLGVAYDNGKGITQDQGEAVRWFRNAAEQGLALAQYNLGVAYDNGEGVAQDQREAVRWLQKAADQGLALAQYNLGVAYDNGKGVAQDQREAVRWYRKAAEQGLASAQNNLGLAYNNGEGITQDQGEAVRWFRKAAKQGLASAQYNLGLAYDNGEGVAQDQREAVRWYRKAAEQGLASAQNNLGVAYDNGEGVTQDQREAVRWFQKAAEQGLASAQTNLGFAYYNGEGVITDKREAYIWFSIAKANGSDTAALGLLLNDWHDDLSQSGIRSAQKEAARRMEAIENGRKQPTESLISDTSIAIASAPERSGIAEQVFETVWRSVVVVHDAEGQGSGVIIRPNIVATNCHVVEAGGDIVVYKADRRRIDTDVAFAASIRHLDAELDFCLLDVAGLWGIPAAVRRYDTLKIGETVYALGAPRGLDLSLSDGLVSQLRDLGGVQMIQTNAAISPGSSGGGLFDNAGNLVGIMTAKISDESTEGIGFAIPADLVLEH